MSGTGYTFLASLAYYLAKARHIGLFKEYICQVIKESIDIKLGVKNAYFGT